MLRRRTDRRPFGRFRIPDQLLQQLVTRASERGALLRPIEAAENGELLRSLLADAADSQDHDPDYQLELAIWARRDVSEDGIPRTSLLGPTGRAWNGSRNFPAGQIEIPVGAAPDRATFPVLGTSSDDRLSQLRAGEAASAVLLRATAMGLASCPLSQPLEVAATRLRLRDEILGGTVSPQLVLRLGWAQWGTPRPITPRRAVADYTRPMPSTRLPKMSTTTPAEADGLPRRPLDFWLKLVDTLINRQFRAMLEQHGIVRRQWEMMRMLSRGAASPEELDTALAPFLPEGELAPAAGGPTELVESGWLTCVDGAYELTERGRVAHRRLEEVFEQKNQDLSKGIPIVQYALVVSVLEQVAANLGWRDPAATP